MADPASRKATTLRRLRSHLRKQRESLADQFEFKMYMAVVFKDKTKRSALFEMAEVIPVMTNDFKGSIMKGVQEEVYSRESSQQLLEKDVIQLHTTRYRSLRKDVLGHVQEIDFFFWPRSDIEKVVCQLFSRWKGDGDSEYRLIQANFEFAHLDYEKQLLKLVNRKDSSGLIINNPSQSMFLFMDKHHVETEKRNVTVFKISSVCLHLPQDQLLNWGSELREDVVSQFMPP